MNKLELFSERDMKGDSVSIDTDNPDLTTMGFFKRAKSLIVNGDPWIIFTESNYQREFKVYKEGNHNSIPGFEEKICSARVVKGGLYDPEITVYEHPDYKGKALQLKKNVEDFRNYGFDDILSAHKVTRGAWILYEDRNYQGTNKVAVAGDHVPDYIQWHDKVSSAKFISA